MNVNTLVYRGGAVLFFRIVLMIFFLMYGINGFSQYVAYDLVGEDRLSCGNQVSIGSPCDFGGYTWTWSDPSISGPNPTVNPSVSTTYVLTLKNLDNGDITTAPVTVIVVTGLTVTAEDNIIEAMEGRNITYTANVTANFPPAFNGEILYKFNFFDAQNFQSYPTFPKTIMDNKLTIPAPMVPLGSAGHKMTTIVHCQIVLGTDICGDANANIDVYELWIDYVRDAATNKNWKIVVGEDIEYNAIAANTSNNWDWNMEDEDNSIKIWHPTGGIYQSHLGGSLITIPDTDLPECEDWDHFGDQFGTISVYCEDGEGRVHKTYSRIPPSGINSPTNDAIIKIMNTQEVEVYFDHTKTTNPTGDKNWFCYWKASLFSGVPNIPFNPAIAYGSTSGTSPYTIQVGDASNLNFMTAYNHINHLTSLGVPSNLLYTRPTADGKEKIDLFYSALTHELQHRVDFPFYGNSPDTDGDFLPNTYDPHPNIINGAGYVEYVGNAKWQGDWEKNGRNIENVTAPSIKDWSKEGKQW